MRITKKIELPPDSRSDEIMLQIVKCGRCRFEAIAVYEECRRGGFGYESVDHRGYYVSAADLKTVKIKISQCPNPSNGRCRCRVHKQLGSKDISGRWDGLAAIELGQRFVMKIR
jgi:hypothetical protein